SPLPGSSLPPAIAAIALLLTLSLTNVQAAESKESAESAVQNSITEVSIVSANYSGTVNDRVAALTVTLQFSAAKAGQTIPLFGPDVAVQQFTVKNGEAKLVRGNDGVAVRLGNRGDVTLQIQMLARVAGDVTKRQLAFLVPAALSSRVAL